MLLPPMPDSVQRLYAGLAWWEKWHAKWRWRLCPFVQIAATVSASAKVMDIGCGRGMLANYLALTGPDRMVLGIDNQEQRIAAARATIGERRNIRFLFQDALTLPDEEFNVVVISDMLHHLPFPAQETLLARCYDLLRPRGELLLEEVGARPRWKYAAHFLIDRTLNLGRRQYFRKPEQWLIILSGLGFKVSVEPAHRHIPLPDYFFRCRK